MESKSSELEKQVVEVRKTLESISSEGEEKRIAAVKAEYDDEISSLNEQIAIMEEALKEEETKTNALKAQQEQEVASFHQKEDELTKQVETLSHDLNDVNDSTRAIQKETQEKEEEMARLRERMRTMLEASKVLQAKETKQEEVRGARGVRA